MLQYETRTYKYINYSDLEDFIKEVYAVKNYELLSDMECSNDSYLKFNVQKTELSKWDLEALDIFKQDEYYTFVTSIVLLDLCNKDLIEPGEYLVNVSW